ncbi:uncharacterized protein LOC113775505 [Coffea eugenioides]|uniref:uncharacterized protein LOC113775505 n=1 Tax=Coffea eugenioides TaxID=49369 RepID=UPI000F6089D4|nr:uncharacterized protein LOC113775505 [Coffea eugenioides]
MESYLNENFEVKPKNSSEEVLQRWRHLCGVVKNPRRRFRFTTDLSKRYEAAAIRRTNQAFQEYIRYVIAFIFVSSASLWLSLLILGAIPQFALLFLVFTYPLVTFLVLHFIWSNRVDRAIGWLRRRRLARQAGYIALFAYGRIVVNSKDEWYVAFLSCSILCGMGILGFFSAAEDFVMALQSISTYSGAAALELMVLGQHPVQASCAAGLYILAEAIMFVGADPAAFRGCLTFARPLLNHW